eukprot:Nitzschia sp. Nitz4//scaffold80_size88189//68016//69563//NITZ4_005092-RA/size88189-processed-gene-0.63-mRNA-1//1//CDS//3329558645//1766//frame0
MMQASPTIPVSPDEFLDTIPEDQSVAQDQRAAGWGAVSPTSTTAVKPGNRKGTGSVISGVSDANAIIEEGEEQEGFRKGSSPSPSNNKSWNLQKSAFYTVLVTLIAAIAVGIYFIVTEAIQDDDSADPGDGGIDATSAPALATFPPGFSLEDTDPPSASPSYNAIDTAQLDDLLLTVSSEVDYFDSTTPQGICRYWMTHSDLMALTVANDGEAAVIQRYVLCVLYESTGGEATWSTSFLDDTLPGCDWTGVSCDADNNVVVLDLADSNILGTLPEEIAELTTLVWISLGGNELSGTVPPSYMDMPNLRILDLSKNSLTGTIPDPGVAPLDHLYLDYNDLEGNLPYWDTMISLRVQRNKLTSFDEQYISSQSLERWRMYSNSFTGSLPQDWDTPNLVYLDFSLNDWGGSIPSSLWNLPLLSSLILHESQLTGTLPNTTVSDHWKHLWLHKNQLEGTVPISFGDGWVNLTELLLYDNLLTGHIADEHCDHFLNLTKFETDCNLESLTCDCCTACYGE